MLREFLVEHREEILARSRARVAARNAPVPTDLELTTGLPVFLEQLNLALTRAAAHAAVNHDAIGVTATKHGGDLFRRGLTVAQVVHDYGDLCQVITGLATERDAPINASEFQTLNLCLDDAIAGAVTEFTHHRERALAEEGTERVGVLAHEMRNLLNAAMITFGSIKKGIVAPGGSTSAIHDRSLLRMQTLIDRSFADVRLEAGMQNIERVAVWEVFEEVEIGASVMAQSRGLSFSKPAVDPAFFVDADRQILAAAIANLLQNAMKFTRPGSGITLAASATDTRVLIDVGDECGGLPSGKLESLLRPFEQRGKDRTGLGLGLSICIKAARAMLGELRIKDLPGKGCIFTIDLPRQPPPPTSLQDYKREHAPAAPGPGGTTARGKTRGPVGGQG